MIGQAPTQTIRSAHDYVERKWGAATQTVPLQSIAVLTTATPVLKNNPRRLAVEIFNPSTQGVSIGFDGNVTTANGILIPSLGGSVIMQVDEDMDLITYNVFAIAAAAGSTIYVVETQIV